MATSPVFATRSGTGFTIDVTSAQLDNDLTTKDFIILFGTAPNQTVNPNSNWVKTSQTVLTYTGSSLGSTNIEVRRSTPTPPINNFAFSQRISSGDLNAELDRITRRAEEYATFGVGPSPTAIVSTPLDTAFGVAWDGNTVNPPTMNAVYDYVNTLAPKASPAFTGTPTAPTAATADNTTTLATTAHVKANLASYAPLASPTLTGTPLAPSPASSDNSTKIATTGFVYSLLASSNAVGVTQTKTDNTTKLATTEFAHIASVVKSIKHFVDATVRAGAGAWQLAVGSTTITPRSANSRFLVIAVVMMTNSSGTGAVLTRLRLNGATTLVTGSAFQNYLTTYPHATLIHDYFPGTTTPFTLNVDGTSHDSSAFTINSASSVVLGETVAGKSSLIIIEYENTI